MVAHMHAYVWEHLFSRTAWWILMKLGRDGTAQVFLFFDQIRPYIFYRPDGHSNKLNAQKGCKSMLEEVLCFFGSIPKSNF